MKIRHLALTACCSLLAFTGCTPTPPSIPTDPRAENFGTITISSGISAETDIVAHIYALALEEAGYTVEIVDTGDTRAQYLAAMHAEPVDPKKATSAPAQVSASASISFEPANNPETVDITADYSGNLLLHLTDDGRLSLTDIEAAKERSTASPAPMETGSAQPTNTSTQVAASPSASANPLNVRGMTGNDILGALGRVTPVDIAVLNAASAENKDALVITRATAEKYGLASINDLAAHCTELAFGASSVFAQSSHGLTGLKEVYNCIPGEFKRIDDQRELSDALAHHKVQVADIFTGSSEITDNDYVILEDSANLFISQQIVPVVRIDELPSSAQDAINTVSGKLSTEDLVLLNKLTTGDNSITHEDAAMFWFSRLSE